jgi:predicted membrane protein
METLNQNTVSSRQPDNAPKETNRSGRIFAGALVVFVGVVFLLRRAGVDLPYWITTWPMFLIAIGLFIGIRHSFRGFIWAFPIVIGLIFLLDDFYPYYDFYHFTWPLVIIAVGLFIMFRGGKKNRNWSKWEDMNSTTHNFSDDYIDSTVVFGGVKKNIISKNFRGGEASTVFGGTEINLTQADVDGKIVLEITQIFGGTKLLVPPHWVIQSEDLVSVFGGVEDKRPAIADMSKVDSNKVLILKGTCIFGGIDIKSY